MVASAVAVGVLALSLSACGTASQPEESPQPSESPGSAAAGTKLTVWVDETREKAVESAASAFQAANGVQVEVVKKNFDDIRPDFIAQVPTGQGPDIIAGPHDWLGELITNGVVAPLELGAKASEFNPVSLQAFTADGQTYGLPYAVENIGLIRNADLVPQAAEATWDATVAAGKAAGKKYPIVVQVGETGDGYTLYPLQTSFGAPVFAQNADGSYEPELALGGDNGHAYAEWLAAQGEAGLLSPDVTYDIAVAAFADGESPYIIGGPWMLDQFKDVNVAIDPLPAAGTHEAKPFVGVQGFYLSAQSKNTLVANDFLVNYLSSEDVQYALYEAGGRPPALTAAAQKASQDPVIAGFAAVGQNAVPMPSIAEMGSVWSFWGATEVGIMNGSLEPVAGWDKMVSDIEGAIKG
jgi:arabinogalactan oligomer/maltooligosaccharide transport system substrate-binding protein